MLGIKLAHVSKGASGVKWQAAVDLFGDWFWLHTFISSFQPKHYVKWLIGDIVDTYS